MKGTAFKLLLVLPHEAIKPYELIRGKKKSMCLHSPINWGGIFLGFAWREDLFYGNLVKASKGR